MTTEEMSLDKWLEMNIAFLRKSIKEVKPNGDLPPILISRQPTGYIQFTFPEWTNGSEKNMQILKFVEHLKKINATHYSLISASWMVKLTKQEAATGIETIQENNGSIEGTPFENRRIEVYTVIVGDHSNSYITSFNTKRNLEGRITKLIKIETMKAATGRMVNLLNNTTLQ